MSLDHIREEIMLASLSHVTVKGWSKRALHAGTLSAGYDPITLQRAFPNGIADLISTFWTWVDHKMLEALSHHDLSLLGMTERIALALRVRFEVLDPYKQAVRSLMGYGMFPHRVMRAARYLYTTVDHIWYAVGDRATDFSFYSKRTTLMSILMSVTLYWLEDSSEGMKDTSLFINRALRSFIQTTGLFKRITKRSIPFPDPFRFIHRVRHPCQKSTQDP